MGKGDTQRPVDKKKYDEEWDRIFKKKPPRDKLLDEGFRRNQNRKLILKP